MAPPCLAWIDESGVLHYYGYGSDGVTRHTEPLIVDRGSAPSGARAVSIPP